MKKRGEKIGNSILTFLIFKNIQLLFLKRVMKRSITIPNAFT